MGNLFIVATPIGNLQDITLRALKVLEEVDFIASEDTRTSMKLINNFFPEKKAYFQNKIYSYYEQSEAEKIPKIMNILLSGKNVALISDAGTPLISDPGFKLVRECIKNNINVVSIPGPTSVISSLVSSGLPTDKFTFLGFLPQKPGHRINFLKNVKKSLEYTMCTVIYFESPYKFFNNLKDLMEVFGDINIVVAREQTKIHEELYVGKITQVLDRYKNGIKGEITILFNIKET